jgi:aminobenzoyl-glutamate utilization protein B
MKRLLYLMALLAYGSFALAQSEINPKIKPDKDKQFVVTELDKKFNSYKEVARDIWNYAELGFLETKSTSRLQTVLKDAGFNIETGIADMPTAFLATYGSGEPVIGILAEFDALPGLSQDSVTFKKPIIEGGAGHACGHHTKRMVDKK